MSTETPAVNPAEQPKPFSFADYDWSSFDPDTFDWESFDFSNVDWSTFDASNVDWSKFDMSKFEGFDFASMFAAMPEPDDPIEMGAKFNPFDPSFLADPHAFFARAREEAPVCHNGFMDYWIVTRYEDAMRVLSDFKLFSSDAKIEPPESIAGFLAEQGYPVAAQLFGTDPPVHTRIRTLFLEGFTPRRIAALEPGVRKHAHELVDAMVAGNASNAADLRAAYIHPLPRTVILDLIGVPREDHAQLEAWHEAWGNLYNPMASQEALMDSATEVVKYQHYYGRIIDERRADPGEDMVSALVTAAAEGLEPLQDAELVWQLMGLLAAGHETTTNALSNTLVRLLEDHDQWQQMVADPAQDPGRGRGGPSGGQPGARAATGDHPGHRLRRGHRAWRQAAADLLRLDQPGPARHARPGRLRPRPAQRLQAPRVRVGRSLLHRRAAGQAAAARRAGGAGRAAAGVAAATRRQTGVRPTPVPVGAEQAGRRVGRHGDVARRAH